MSESEARNYKYEPVTAQRALEPYHDKVTPESDERAREAGVIDAASVDYEVALENYEARPDVETLERRRAREVGSDFKDASFRRTIEGLNDPRTGAAGGVVTSEKVTQDQPKNKKAYEKGGE